MVQGQVPGHCRGLCCRTGWSAGDGIDSSAGGRRGVHPSFYPQLPLWFHYLLANLERQLYIVPKYNKSKTQWLIYRLFFFKIENKELVLAR